MKAREVREQLKGKCDPQLMYVLEAMAERFSVMQEQQVALAQTVDQITDIVTNFVSVAQNMKNSIDEMKTIQGDDCDEPTH